MKKLILVTILTTLLISCQNSKNTLESSSNASRGEIEAATAESGLNIPSELTE